MAFLRGERELNLFLWDGDTLHVWGGRRKEGISFLGRRGDTILPRLLWREKQELRAVRTLGIILWVWKPSTVHVWRTSGKPEHGSEGIEGRLLCSWLTLKRIGGGLVRLRCI